MKSWLMASLLIITMLAGCAEDDTQESTDSVETPTATSQTGKVLNATLQDGNFTSADEAEVFILPGAAGPDSPLRAFHWRVPEDALVESNPGSSFSSDYVYLEVVPEVNASLTDWGILVFSTESGVAIPVASALGVEATVTNRLAVIPDEQTIPAAIAPMYMQINGNSVQEGDRLSWVIWGTSSSEASFDIGFRVLDERPDYQDDPTSSIKKLAAGKTVVELLEAGRGAGAAIALYADINLLGAIGAEIRTPEVEVIDRLPVDARPAVTTRDVTLRTDFDSDGWSTGLGIYIGYESHGLWSADVSAHGTDFQANSIIAQDFAVPYVLLAELILLGLPIFIYQGDGPGDASAQFDVLVTNVNVLELFLFQQVSLGAVLEDLVGVPGDTFALATTGLLGNVPPMTEFDVSGDDLIIRGEHQTVFPGLLKDLHAE